MNEIVSPFECNEAQSNLKNNLRLPLPEKFKSVSEEREHKKKRLVSALKIFSRCGFDEGVAGHITVRDPEHLDSFWVNPFGIHFSIIKTSDHIKGKSWLKPTYTIEESNVFNNSEHFEIELELINEKITFIGRNN